MFKMGRGTGHLAPDCSSLFSDDKICRRLRFKASAEGQLRANKIRRTARLEALLRKIVKDESDREILASAGAIQKSISFTLPRRLEASSISAPVAAAGVANCVVTALLTLVWGETKASTDTAEQSRRISVDGASLIVSHKVMNVGIMTIYCKLVTNLGSIHQLATADKGGAASWLCDW